MVAVFLAIGRWGIQVATVSGGEKMETNPWQIGFDEPFLSHYVFGDTRKS
jgi:hypothetical protein